MLQNNRYNLKVCRWPKLEQWFILIIKNEGTWLTGDLEWASGDYVEYVFTTPIEEWANEGTTQFLEVDKSSPNLAGEVIAWPSETVPTGWLECDGSSVLKAKYEDLYNSIGDSFNTAEYIDNSGNVHQYTAPDTGYFRLPDYRNLYLRGNGANTVGDVLDDTTAVNGILCLLVVHINTPISGM